ncbi:MAG: phosphate ABC transporter permease PstA [Pseudomonadota bacterium]
MDTFLKGQMTDIEEMNPDTDLVPSLDGDTVTLVASTDVFSDVLAAVKVELEAEAEKTLESAQRETRGIAVTENDLAALRVRADQAVGAERESLDGRIAALETDIAQRIRKLEAFNSQADQLLEVARSAGGTLGLTAAMPSVLVEVNGGVVKAQQVANDRVIGDAYIPLQSTAPAASGEWTVVTYVTPERGRQVNDQTATWLRALQNDGAIERTFADVLFTKGDSRAPEQAGLWGAVVGSFLTLIITLMLSFPIGVLAAIYLEEFAPQNRITDLIEVNINNLAAVPSIVFGLLGLAMFLNFFGLPRSAPLVGGMVLALMTLPTIIIATRAALKAVPPSIREAALGIGASKVQVITHHVLPLAMPGILTGTIIGMAQALGETAPLLMIGMVAFIVDVPGGFTDPATVLPVQIYIWADSPERAFVAKTSAAIMVLLTFLIMMNALAVLLRRRFERRW